MDTTSSSSSENLDGNVFLAVVGSRNFKDYPSFQKKMDEVFLEWGLQNINIRCVISGGAPGVDSMAERWAREKEFHIRVHKADWTRHGRAAGPLRNSIIVENSTHLVAFPSRKGTGTQDTIRKAKLAGLISKVYYVEDLRKKEVSTSSFQCE